MVRHNTKFATAHSQVTVSGCPVECEYKLVHQFTTTVGTIYGLNSQEQLTAGPHKAFLLISRNRTEQLLKGYRYTVILQTIYGKPEKFFFSLCMALQRCHTNR